MRWEEEEFVYPTQDLHVSRIVPLPPPGDLKRKIGSSERANATVVEGRKTIQGILAGEDGRMLAVVGPCSIHRRDEALDYAARLRDLSERLSDKFFLVMRVYFEKPRTRVGWKGLISDPHMDESADIQQGIEEARAIATVITDMGLPIGSEALDPILIRYLSDCLSWTSIGARTTESQTHREMASGLSMPVGFKNSTDGSIENAVDAMASARHPHSFVGINDAGVTSIIRTRGNPWGHLILRGGRNGGNYQPEYVAHAQQKLREAGLSAAIMVDCSHGNSGKDPARQAEVLGEVMAQKIAGNRSLIGFMLESNLFPGRQNIPTDLSQLRYGVSVTDACIGWEETERILTAAYQRQ